MTGTKKNRTKSPILKIMISIWLIAIAAATSFSLIPWAEAAGEPSSYSETLTSETFRGYSNFAREKVADRPVVELFSFENIDVASLATVATGSAIVAEIGTSGMVGIFMDASTDAYPHRWKIPADCDVTKPIRVNVEWSNSEAAATGSNLWTVTYLPLVSGTTAIATPTIALDTILASQVDLAANIPQYTAFGEIKEDKSGVATLTAGTDSILFQFVTTLTSIVDVTLISAQIQYYRRFIG